LIYLLFWWYYINCELRDYGRVKRVDLGTSPRNSVLAIAVGWIIIVPPILSTVRTFRRIQFAQKLAGVEVLKRLDRPRALPRYLSGLLRVHAERPQQCLEGSRAIEERPT